ncbi:hypothetical protein JT359_00985 [Candidatus Poribacteria bacterium]|nr:hypothetical protein [Candidatus Poribacteria bacterium]
MNKPTNKIILNLDGDEKVNVKGVIAPFEYDSADFHVDWDELANLRAAEPEKQYPVSVFQSFLPSESVSVGECWQIQEEDALTLLRQLSPRPQLKLHINSGDPRRAMWACLRAYNDEFAEILFRIHAQFVMNHGWLTPSQFAGHLVIDRFQEEIVSFKMHVPQTTLNFDIGWTNEDKRTAAAIGYCPKVELCAGIQPQNAEFVASITQEEAEGILALQFYEFEKINWVSLEEALEMAPALQKPIHAISIDGPLADESC